MTRPEVEKAAHTYWVETRGKSSLEMLADFAISIANRMNEEAVEAILPTADVGEAVDRVRALKVK